MVDVQICTVLTLRKSLPLSRVVAAAGQSKEIAARTVRKVNVCPINMDSASIVFGHIMNAARGKTSSPYLRHIQVSAPK